MTEFVHLRVRSEYSIVDGIVRLKPLVARVAQLGMPAVAVTDHCNLFGLIKFYKAALASGVQPIAGADVWIRDARPDGSLGRLTLLAQNQEGYHHLTRLLSRAWQEGQERGDARLDLAWLEGLTGGLIALSGSIDGVLMLGSGVPMPLDATTLGPWMRLFPDRFYLELTRTQRAGEEEWIEAALEAAAALHLPVVATNDVRFLHAKDFDAHEARVCIHDGVTLADPRRTRTYSEEQYLRTPGEMAELFADLPEALRNAVAIARRCALRLDLGRSLLPDFPLPDGETAGDYLRVRAREGLAVHLARHRFASEEDYVQRLERELEVICQMEFPGYFLIVADFIGWARRNGIPVGPGRGSGAGSLVAYALGITNIDPLRYDLLFERFLNPERVSMPDFDIDFCMDRRDRVIEYVMTRYGRDRVSQIITHGTMAAKAVVRDCGRILGYGYGFVDRIAKLVPTELGMTLPRALQESEELKRLYDQDEEVQSLLDLALQLEGLTRNAGKHAGGVVIAPTALTDFSALYCEAGGSSLVTHFDKDDVEAIGLVKFDFLGLRTLTIIDWALESIRARSGTDSIDLDDLPLDDVATFDLLRRYQTTAVFQLESSGIKDLVRRLQPDTFEDLIALVALYRPGPLQSGMVDDFIDRKHGRAVVEYLHPALEPILKPTYGVIVYQEQVMQIAQVLAGYTLGGADLLRRAMGKKKAEEMAKQRETFVQGARARGVAESVATKIFDLMEMFAGYGFNKSHSAAYAVLAYQTAWLKAHHPAHFMAAVLSADMDDTDKVVPLIEECRGMGLSVRSPDINRSAYRFAAIDDQTIAYGLGAIKGVGKAAIDAIAEGRSAQSPFTSLLDVCQRVDLGKVTRRVLEILVRSGAMDSLGMNRASLLAALPVAVEAAEQAARQSDSGVEDLFGEVAVSVQPRIEHLPEMEEEERLHGEKESLGLYLTGHPIDRYREELRRLTGNTLQDLEALLERQQARAPVREGRGREGRGRDGDAIRIAGWVVGIRLRNTQGGRMAVVTLDDQTSRVDVVLFNEEFRQHQERLVVDQLLVVVGVLSRDDYAGGVRVRAQQVWTLDEARAQWARFIEIQLGGRGLQSEQVRTLQTVLQNCSPGGCRLRMRYVEGAVALDFKLPEHWQVRPEEAVLRRVQHLVGQQGRVALHY